jgi:uncharacterized membrane protein
MTYLYLGLALFMAPHAFSMFLPSLRDGMKIRFGENAFKGVYSLVSLAGVACMVVGYSNVWATGAGTEAVYDPPAWGRHATMLLVLMAFVFIAASHGKGHLKLWLRNPMSIGIALWAFGHLLANGTRFDVWLFGSFLVLGVLDVILSTLRGKTPSHEPRLRSDVVAVIAGMVIYAAFVLLFHPYVLGVPVAQ